MAGPPPPPPGPPGPPPPPSGGAAPPKPASNPGRAGLLGQIQAGKSLKRTGFKEPDRSPGSGGGGGGGGGSSGGREPRPPPPNASPGMSDMISELMAKSAKGPKPEAKKYGFQGIAGPRDGSTEKPAGLKSSGRGEQIRIREKDDGPAGNKAGWQGNQRPCCSKCHLPFTAAYYTTQRGIFHDECLPRDTCHKCKEPIDAEEKRMKAEGYIWHPRCFNCFNCGNPMMKGYYKKNDDWLCPPCYTGILRPGTDTICYGCNGMIIGDFSEWKGNKYHLKCFVCYSCQEKLLSEYCEVKDMAMCFPCAKEYQRFQYGSA